MSRANNCAIPVAHHNIITILETVRARAIPDALLTLLEFLQKAEITRYYAVFDKDPLNAPKSGRFCTRTFGHRMGIES